VVAMSPQITIGAFDAAPEPDEPQPAMASATVAAAATAASGIRLLTDALFNVLPHNQMIFSC